MGLHFAHNTLKMGHPVTVFLNLDAVKLAAVNDTQDKKGVQGRLPREIIAEFISDGGGRSRARSREAVGAGGGDRGTA